MSKRKIKDFGSVYIRKKDDEGETRFLGERKFSIQKSQFLADFIVNLFDVAANADGNGDFFVIWKCVSFICSTNGACISMDAYVSDELFWEPGIVLKQNGRYNLIMFRNAILHLLNEEMPKFQVDFKVGKISKDFRPTEVLSVRDSEKICKLIVIADHIATHFLANLVTLKDNDFINHKEMNSRSIFTLSSRLILTKDKNKKLARNALLMELD